MYDAERGRTATVSNSMNAGGSGEKIITVIKKTRTCSSSASASVGNEMAYKYCTEK